MYNFKSRGTVGRAAWLRRLKIFIALPAATLMAAIVSPPLTAKVTVIPICTRLRHLERVHP